MATLFHRPKRKTFYHRSMVPRKLLPYFGRGQIWRSLRTNDRDQATLRSAQFTVHFQKLFVKLKKDAAHMTPTETEALIARWMSVQVSTVEDSLASTPKTDDWFEGADMVWDGQYAELHEKMAACDYRKVSPEVDELLKDAGIPTLLHDSLEFKHLCRRLLRAKLDLVDIERDRSYGVYPPAVLPPMIATAVPPPVKDSPLFTEVAKKYLEENSRSRRPAPQVVVEYGKFLQAIGGDRPIGNISKTDIRGYKETLLRTRKLALRTTGKHLRTLSGVFTWAEKQGYLPEGKPNPVRGLAPSDAESEKGAQEIHPFTDEQLLRVFSSPNFRKQRVTRPDRYWVTLLCLYQLCRREEGAQLAMKDLGEENGIPFIVITDLGEDQSTKNPGSKRRIPIHSSLIALGFLDLVQDARRHKQTRLFHQLPQGPNGHSDAIGKWFGRHLDKVGLSQPELVMHSLRHRIHYLHALGCPSDVAEMLTGHTASSEHNKYEHRELNPLTRLREGLECMQFPAVLTALTVPRC